MSWRTVHRSYSNQLLDPDFDEIGGELVLAQIFNPVWAPWTKSPAGNGDPDFHLKREQETLRYRRARLRPLVKRLRQVKHQHLHNAINHAKDRLQRTSYRFRIAHTMTYPRFLFEGNYSCNKCIPYNWQFTPRYWGTGQSDDFVEPQ